jgi:PAS domain S-box-containing protein
VSENGAPGESAATAPTILVVEDNPITRKLFHVALGSEGYEVLEAPDGARALVLAEARRPDLVLQDLVLPDIDGFDLVHRLRRVPGMAGVPIVACSAFVSALGHPEIASLGFADFLLKPIDPSRLLEAVRGHLRSRATVDTQPGRGRRILAVDDDPIQLKLLGTLLTGLGFEVDTAGDGKAALEQAWTRPPDAIVSDTLMPHVDGFRLCLAARRDPRLARVPVVLFSAIYQDETARALARKVGASALVARTPSFGGVVDALLASLAAEPPAAPAGPMEAFLDEHTREVARQLGREAARNAELAEHDALQTATLAILSGVADALASAEDPATILGDVLAQCLDAAGLPMAALYVTGADGELSLRAQSGYPQAAAAELATLWGHAALVRDAAAAGTPLALPGGRVPGEPARDFLARAGGTSALVVPLLGGGECVGAILMVSDWKDLTAAHWLSFARTLSVQFGQALRLSRKRREAEALAGVARTLTESLNVSAVAERIVESVLVLFGVRSAGFRLLHPDGSLVAVAADPSGVHAGPGDVLAPGMGISGRVLAEGRPVRCRDLLADPGFVVDDAIRARLVRSDVRAFLAVPLRAQGKAIGVLSIADRVGREFSEAEATLLQTFADQAALALQNARLYEEAERRRQAAESLAELGRLLSRSLDLDVVAAQIVESVGALLGAQEAALYRLEPSGALRALAASGGVEALLGPGRVLPPGAGVAGLAVRERQAVAISDLVQDPRVTLPADVRGRADALSSRAVLAVPLLVQDRVIGVLAIGDRAGREFAPDETALARAFGDQAALALENARHYEEAEQRRREAEVLAELARNVNASLDLDTVFQRVAEGARGLCGGDLAAIALRDPDSGTMAIRYGTGFRSGFAGVRIEPGQGAGGSVIATGRPFRTDEYLADNRVAKDDAAPAKDEGIVAQVVVPILTGGRVEGLIYVSNRTRRPFTDRDEAIILRLAEHAAIALGNAALLNREREARAAAETSDQRFRLAARATRDTIWDRDLLTDAVTRNDGGLGIFGYSPEEAGSHAAWWLERVHPDDAPRLVAGVRAAIDGTGESWTDEYRFRRRDGSYASVVDRAYLVRDEAGRAIRMIGAMADITPRKQAEEALKTQAQVLDAMAEGMSVTDPDGTIVITNPAFDAMFGYARGELVGQPVTVLNNLAPEESARLVGEVIESLETTGTWSGEFVNRRKDGSPFTSQASIKTVELSGRRHWVSVQEDVTGRKQAEAAREELERQFLQAQKMEAVGQLAGGVAHDFNNLLTVIRGRSQMLLKRLDPKAPLRRHVQLIDGAADRAAALTRQLLAFGRKQVFQPRVLDVNAVVAATEKMLRRLIGEDIELVTALEPAVGRVKADPGQLDQVIMNLAVNARDAMPRGGRLVLETGNVELDETAVEGRVGLAPGRYVTLVVRDAGCGMDAATLARIFEPFFTTKEPGKGTGLGLATVFGIVKQSGGHIEVESAPGRGATFTIHLPRVEEAADASDPETPAAAVKPGSETVLLVEDEDELREMIGEMLEAAGYGVLQAGGGEEALQVAARHPGSIQLLLTDVVMPHMGGRELAERLATRHPALKVLYVSGYTDDRIGDHGVLDPGIALLHKPFTPASLTDRVREVLDAPLQPE